MNKSKNTKAYRLFMDSQKKVLARKYPFLSARQLQSKANEQWNLLYRRKEKNDSISREKSKTHYRVSEIGKKSTRPREIPVSPKRTNFKPDFADEFGTSNSENRVNEWGLLKEWDVSMWTTGRATRRGYGAQSRGCHRKVPQIVEDEPWHNQQGILTSNKPEDEKKKAKCSVSFYDMAVTHHYPAMSPGTPPSHKVFTFSSEERARIQKVLKRSQQQDTPVLKIVSPVSVVSTSSEDDDDARDSVLLKYNHTEAPRSPVSLRVSPRKSQDNGVNGFCKFGMPPVTPCTPQVNIALSPRVMLAGLTPATSVLPKSDSPSQSSSSLSSVGAENSEPASQVSNLYESPVGDVVKKSPTKRKSPNSDTDGMASDAKSQKKSIKSTAIRKVDFSEQKKTQEQTSVPQRISGEQQSSCESKSVHTSEMSKLYETMFGFLSDCSQEYNKKSLSEDSDNNLNIKKPTRTSPRKCSASPQRDSPKSGISNSDNLNTTPTRPTPTSCNLSRTPFRTLVFDSLQAGVIGKPPSMPSSAKRITSRVKNGGVGKPMSKYGASSSLTPSVSTPGLTSSRSSKRVLSRTWRRSFNEPSENIESFSQVYSTSDLDSDTQQGSSVKQTSGSKSKTLSRSNGFASLSSMQSENRLSGRLEYPPSPIANSLRSSPRRSVLSSPRAPVRSSPRKSNSLPVLTDNRDVLNNNTACTSASSDSFGKISKQEICGRSMVDDTVQKMRNVAYHETANGLSEFLAATRTPSECSQLSDVSSIASGDSEQGDFETAPTENIGSNNLNKLLAEVGKSLDPQVKGPVSRKARSPSRSTTPSKGNPRRSSSWAAPQQPQLAERRNRSATRMKSPKKVQERLVIPKLIVTEHDEVLQLNGVNAKSISKKQREDFLCNLFVDLTPPSKQPIGRRVLKSCGETSKDTFEQFLKGTGDADIFF